MKNSEYDGNDYEIRYSFTFKTYTSELFCNGTLVDTCTHSVDGNFKVIVHKVQPTNHTSNHIKELIVSVGYFNWLSVGIEVRDGSDLI